MRLKVPGAQSKSLFLLGSVWAFVIIGILLGGHAVLFIVVLSMVIPDMGGIQGIIDYTHIPQSFLWLSVVAALGLDVWGSITARQEKHRKKKR